MLSIIVSLLVLAAILVGAGYQLHRIFTISKHGGCAACEYECATKKHLQQQLRTQNKHERA